MLEGCPGDSGATLWITDTGPESTNNHGFRSKKNILLAVHSGAIRPQSYLQPNCSSGSSLAHKITEKLLDGYVKIRRGMILT